MELDDAMNLIARVLEMEKGSRISLDKIRIPEGIKFDEPQDPEGGPSSEQLYNWIQKRMKAEGFMTAKALIELILIHKVCVDRVQLQNHAESCEVSAASPELEAGECLDDIDLPVLVTFDEAQSAEDGPSSAELGEGLTSMETEDYVKFILRSGVRVSRIHVLVDPESKECDYPLCPVEGKHTNGIYNYRGLPVPAEHQAGLDRLGWSWEFGPPVEEYEKQCNPPPWVWAAFWRDKTGVADAQDIQMVEAFKEAHVWKRTWALKYMFERELSGGFTPKYVGFEFIW